METEDDIDLEQLQAHIDMSMSFAHNLVTSWIKPSHKAQTPSNGANISQIIEEELRRPPRLGVGASIPNASLNAHEASKLKRRLVRNSAKNESVVETHPQAFSSKSDDDELKGRPTKRKAKVDPFGQENKKKRKVSSEDTSQLAIPNTSKDSVSFERDVRVREMHKSIGTPSKEKQRTDPLGQKPYEGSKQESLVSSPPVKRLTAPVPGNAQTQGTSRVDSSSIRVPDKATVLSLPLLNLDGPPELSDKADTSPDSNKTKKKRKRRKKKKTHIPTGSADMH